LNQFYFIQTNILKIVAILRAIRAGSAKRLAKKDVFYDVAIKDNY